MATSEKWLFVAKRVALLYGLIFVIFFCSVVFFHWTIPLPGHVPFEIGLFFVMAISFCLRMYFDCLEIEKKAESLRDEKGLLN